MKCNFVRLLVHVFGNKKDHQTVDLFLVDVVEVLTVQEVVNDLVPVLWQVKSARGQQAHVKLPCVATRVQRFQ